MKFKEWIGQNKSPLLSYGIMTFIQSAYTGWLGLWWLWICLQILFTIFFIIDIKLTKHLITMLLCGIMVSTPYQTIAQEEEDKGGDGGGIGPVVIVVFCVTGYCIYKLADYCQRHFSKTQPTTNSPPDELTGEVSGDSEAASFNLGNLGSCAGLDEHPPVTFAINGIIYPADVSRPARAVCSIVAASGKQASMNWSQFVAEAQSYGVKVTGVGDGSSYYARDGKPISEAESIIHYDAQTGKVSVYSDVSKVHRLLVQRSRDLVNWEVFMHLEMEENRNFQILDTTVEGQMFYSIRVIDGD